MWYKGESRPLYGGTSSDDKLEFEVKRSKSITNVAKAITDNANIMLKANKFFDGRETSESTVPDVLRITDGTAKKGTK